MRTWILKTEPDECSLEDIRDAPGGVQRWDGIRNYQARNYLRDEVRVGDRCLVWHSGIKEPALVGRASVVTAAYPDPAQFDPKSDYHDPKAKPDEPRWYAIDIRYAAHFRNSVPTAALRSEPALAGLLLLRNGRISVSPVSESEWAVLKRLAGGERKP